MTAVEHTHTDSIEHEVRASRSPGEVTEVHTRILRLALAIDESRAYWEHVDPRVPTPERANVAFERRWFGAKSMERVRFLLAALGERFDAFPEALSVLRSWPSMDPPTRQTICHWHLQLSDPMYRAFTGGFLLERRALRDPKVDRDVTVRWVKATYPDRWSEATCVQFASKLLSATSEAGLISAKKDPRSLLLPKVTDHALGYLLYLLRGVRFAGTLTENPYLASVGLTEGFLDQRLRAIPSLGYRRMGHLIEFEWTAPNLAAWAEAVR
jgi:hypothetical protein